MRTLLLAEEVFAHALRGEECFLTGASELPLRVPVEHWSREPDEADAGLLELCSGPTIDIGCGPGRLTAALSRRGHRTLGIDVAQEAVGQTRRRGGPAVRRDVFDPVPGEGRWRTALVADGNIGIGGDPTALLGRIRRLLAPGGRAVVEVAAPGTLARSWQVRLECPCASSEPFAWAVVGADDIGAIGCRAGFRQLALHDVGGRWAAVLEEAR